MSGKTKVSIIIPIYNVEKYLATCLESVLAQTYSNIEIILVDDQTPDASGKIADQYAEKDQRIKPIHKPKNEGLNMARATGYKAATGDYIYFLDSDDLLHPQAIEISVTTAEKAGADIVVHGMETFWAKVPKAKKYPKNVTKKDYDIKQTDFDKFQFLLEGGYENLFSMTAWGKLYSREVFVGYDWHESNYRIYEDNFFNTRLYSLAKKIAVLKARKLYFYMFDPQPVRDSTKLNASNRPNEFNGNSLGKVATMDELAKWRTKIIEQLKGLSFIEYERLMEDVKNLRIAEMHHRGSQAIQSEEFLFELDGKYLKEIWEHQANTRWPEISSLHSQVNSLYDEIGQLHGEIDKLHKSKSWNITMPLRTMMFIVKKVCRSILKVRIWLAPPKVSVVVPVYNQGKYVLCPLQSIYDQDYRNIEAIIVNDGSTDDSLKHIEKFITLHQRRGLRWKVISKKNGGTLAARITGLQNITGRWVSFVDGDDYLKDDFIRLLVLYRHASAQVFVPKVDIVASAGLSFLDGSFRVKPFLTGEKDFTTLSSKIADGDWGWSNCGALYSRSLIRRVLPFLTPFLREHLAMGEDLVITYISKFLCRRAITGSHIVGYVYNTDDHGSATQTINLKKLRKNFLDMGRVIEICRDFISGQNISKEYKEQYIKDLQNLQKIHWDGHHRDKYKRALAYQRTRTNRSEISRRST